MREALAQGVAVFDPGVEPGRIWALAEAWREIARELEDISASFTAQARGVSSYWQGAAADAFSSHLQRLIEEIDEGAEAMHEGARHLDELASELDAIKNQALDLLEGLGLGAPLSRAQVLAIEAQSSYLKERLAGALTRWVEAMSSLKGPLSFAYASYFSTHNPDKIFARPETEKVLSCPLPPPHPGPTEEPGSPLGVWDSLQAGLDVGGTLPGVGFAPDLANAVISGIRFGFDPERRQEHLINLGLSAAAMIPWFGLGAGGAKIARTAKRVGDAADDLEDAAGSARLLEDALDAHEGVRGGHTIAKHVGKAVEFLEERFIKEPKLRTVSTFPDKATAATAIEEAIESRWDDIARWLEHAKEGQGFPAFIHDTGKPVGRVLTKTAWERGEGTVTTTWVTVKLVRTEQLPDGFVVKTAFPDFPKEMP